ncbi:MAG: LysR family transcriptional regulator [Alphaproteobacteria bacterium]|nr:LysR family transcriptional regulator [Alphaproteobacteria bacterium]MBV8410180.1 LysR family transcriptional regulator [Alphaproteobacteria bacterium]
MNEIDLRRFDLNLLAVFEALMAERNVTQAALRLGRTQSAVSHALSRLRRQLGDPLLLKRGRQMEPTPLALAFFDEMRPILASLRRVLAPRQRFEPATGKRVFRIAAPDFAHALFTEVLTSVRTAAPGLSIEWTGPRRTMVHEVAEGQLDAAIVPAGLRRPGGIVAEPIGALRWACFARSGHPAFERWGVRSWQQWPHVVVRVGDDLESPIDRAAARLGLARSIAGWVPNFSVVAPVLAESDLLATLPALSMTNMAGPFGLGWRRVPFAIEPLPHVLLWPAARIESPELKWLRRRLEPITKRRFREPQAE